MSYNGSGTFVINSTGQPVVTGTVISSTAFNALTADLATGLSTALTKDGQTTPTANLPMGTFKFTGLSAGSAATDSANIAQVQNSFGSFLTVSGTDTITATVSPSLTAYAAGQMFAFVAANTNTGAVTINISSLGAKSITKNGTTALVASDLTANYLFVIVYDGTQFQLVGVSSTTFANLTVTGVLTLSGAGVQLTSSGTGAWKMPVGTTAQRPTGAAGLIRLNTSTQMPEWYDSVSAAWYAFNSGPTYSVNYLVVAGGGGGGYNGAGGGGAGGLLASSTTLSSGTSYTITVGAGGAGATTAANGVNGSSSSLGGSVTATGGGGGGSNNVGTASNGSSGGSGGGGAGNSGGGSTGGAGTSGQGNTGGNNATASPYPAGGGGGSSAVGANGASSQSGVGGAGTSSSISGSAVTYAGGGGGGARSDLSGLAGAGGAGGGGAGGSGAVGTAGTANTGGGGGGGGYNIASFAGAAGGSGLVVISYAGSQRGTGGTVTSSGGNTIHTFTSSGTFIA
jgi:hypothetical protein